MAFSKLKAVASGFDRDDVPVVLAFVAMALIGYGASQIRFAYGPLAIGVILLLYVRPLLEWIRR